MRLRTVKIGALTIAPSVLIALLGAFFIVGMGIGAAVASPNNAFLALSICSLIGITIWVSALYRKGN